MESEVVDPGQTRQSRRPRIKMSKAIERENSGRQHWNSVVTNPFASQNQRSTEAWDWDENYETETGSLLEVAVPEAPRPNRVQSRTRTLPRPEKTTARGRTVDDERGGAMTSILAAIEDLKPSNEKLHAANGELKAGNEELQTHTKKLMQELAEVKTQLAETKALS
jgi:hypothetical protein